MLFSRRGSTTRIVVGGAVSKTWFLPCATDTEWFGIRFTTGAFMPHLPTAHLLNNVISLPDAGTSRFWLNGCAWEIPTLENAETFVRRLVRAEVLVCDPLLNAVLLDQPQSVSFSTVRRRFLRATGLTPGVMRQIARVQKATRLLKQGISILDTVYEAGYFDQPHLTRSLKHFMGYTPAQITHAYQTVD
jgi:AraC-like DNA-binding protein